MNFSSKIKILKEAIQFRNPVEIEYKEEIETRIVNPYVVYNSIGKSESKVTLDAYQQSGKTSSSNLSFKMFIVDSIRSIKRLETETFSIDNSYNTESNRYADSFTDMKVKI